MKEYFNKKYCRLFITIVILVIIAIISVAMKEVQYLKVGSKVFRDIGAVTL